MRLPFCLDDISRITCNVITGDNTSWCSKAWRQRERHWFWAAWVFVFGREHCRKSNDYYTKDGTND